MCCVTSESCYKETMYRKMGLYEWNCLENESCYEGTILQMNRKMGL